MLDTKRSWDELVLRHAPDEATAYRILDNRLYHNVTSRFVQSHDYIAMERLYELHASGEYDLIVIDTPPTRNAIDFLEAPARMAEFFGGRLLRWLTMPYRIGGGRGGRMINVASRPFYQMADRVLGSQFLQDIAEFFLNFQSMYAGLRRAGAVRRAAAARPADDVRGGDDARGCAAARGGDVLPRARKRDFHLGALVLNKTLPDYLLSADGDHAAESLAREGDAIAAELALDNARRARTVRAPIRPPPRACCARSPTRSATTRSSPGAKRSCAPSSVGWRRRDPRSSCGCRASTPTSTSTDARAGSSLGRLGEGSAHATGESAVAGTITP